MLPATTPAQEFGEWTCLGDERSTTCDNGGVAPRHHARRECSLLEEYASLQPPSRSYAPVDNLLLFATTTGSCLLTRAAWAPIPAQEFGGWKDGCVGKRGDRAGARRVRPLTIFSSLFCLQTGARDSCGTLRPTRTHPCSRIRTVDQFSLAQQHRQAEEYASLRYCLAPLAGTDPLLLFATAGTLPLCLHARTHPCSRI